jgi:GTPase-associated protein 1, N-terminal domain type 2
MLAEQAIFTSLVRRGRSGYHLISRSPGVTDNEASSLVLWAPSHGGLMVDEVNRSSVNFHPLPGGRFALSRTCEGRPEYSGRGSKQVYTHSLVIDVETLAASNYRPFALYRDALALGYFHYQIDPDIILKPVKLSRVYPSADERVDSQIVKELGRRLFDSLVVQIDAGQEVVIPYPGERALLAEALVNSLPTESVPKCSFATGLVPSSVRPYRIHVIPPQPAAAARTSLKAAGSNRGGL